jgi:hypothetical protein
VQILRRDSAGLQAFKDLYHRSIAAFTAYLDFAPATYAGERASETKRHQDGLSKSTSISAFFEGI